jgi:hypothetical protein
MSTMRVMAAAALAAVFAVSTAWAQQQTQRVAGTIDKVSRPSASGGVPQPDGTQKAVELRIFPDSMRGNGDGHRPGWPGAPNGTMTNGAVGQTVTSVDGPVLTVKFKDGEKKLIVGPSVPVQRLEIADRSELKSGAAVAAAAATKQPDGTFTAARIDFGRGDVVP